MATLAQVRADVEDLLYGIEQVQRPAEDTLNDSGGISDSDTEAQFSTESMWKRGDYAEFVPDGELILFTEDHPTAATATIRRGQRDTTAAAQSDGDVVRKNPVFPISLIERMINETIDYELWPKVWMRVERSLTWASTDTSYELDAADHEVERVYQWDLDSYEDLYEFDPGWWRVVTVNTALETSGRALMIDRVWDTNTTTVYYTVRQRPRSSAITDLTSELITAVKWGAAAKCIAARYPSDANRTDRGRLETRESYVLWRQEFERALDRINRRLLNELPPRRTYKPRKPNKHSRLLWTRGG